MKITKQEIERQMTERGGFTRETLAKWGVSWPPPKGWKTTLIDDRPLPTERKGSA